MPDFITEVFSRFTITKDYGKILSIVGRIIKIYLKGEIKADKKRTGKAIF